MSSDFINLVKQSPLHRPTSVLGRVAVTMNGYTDDLWVTIGSFDGHRQRWGPCRWLNPSTVAATFTAPEGAMWWQKLPQRGDPCLVHFDENETPWVSTQNQGQLITNPPPQDIADAKGDLLAAPAADQLDRLPVGTDGQVLTADSTSSLGLKWTSGGGGLISYTEVTADTAISATTDGTANAIVTAPAYTADGTTPIRLEFYAPKATLASTNTTVTFVLYQASTVVCNLGSYASGGFGAVNSPPLYLVRRWTPSSGSKTFGVRAYVNANSATVNAGPGTPGNWIACFLRIIKDV